MKQKYALPPKVLGQIILSKFLKRSPVNYLKYINDTFESQEKLLGHSEAKPKNLKCYRLPNARVTQIKNIYSSNTLAVIKKDKNKFKIYYWHRFMTVHYDINIKKQMTPYLRKLRLISTRNLITHEILMHLINTQKEYFRTENLFCLKPLTQRQLCSVIPTKAHVIPRLDRGIHLIDPSRMSRLIDQKTIILPSGEEVSLKFLFATKKDIYKRHIKIILNQEKKELENEKIKHPYFDTELQKKLKKQNIHISTRYISTLRAELGVAKALKRSVRRFPGQGFSFSAPKALNPISLQNHAPTKSGVYMLCIKPKEIEYPKGKTPIFYIGSSQNIQKRLKNHMSQATKNGAIQQRLNHTACMFRYVTLSNNWQHKEKTLYNLFMATYGARPKANRVSP